MVVSSSIDDPALLDEHLRHCVSDAITAGDPDESARLIGEATNAIERLVKS